MELRKQYINNLKYIIKHDVSVKYDNIIEGYYEWDIDYWRKIKGNEFSPEFNLCGHYWDLKLNKNYSKLSNSLSSFEVILRSKDTIKGEINYSCSVSIREKSNYSEYVAKEMSSRSSEKYSNFDKDYYKNAFKTFLKSDNIVISVYMFIYVNSSKEKKVNFVNNLNHKLRGEDSDNYKLIGKDYYEWKIENWNGIKYNCDAEYSMKFNICGYNWKLKIYPNGVNESNNNVSLYLKNLDVGDIKSHIYVKCALFMANYDNYDSCHIKEFSANFNSNNNTDGIREFIPKDQLYTNYGYHEPLIKNNKVIVGAYLYVYEYKKVDNIIKDIKESIEKRKVNQNEYAQEDYYEWNIDNWKKFKTSKKVIYSPEFEIGGHTWRLFLYPNGNSSDNRENVSLYLHSKNANNGSLIHISADFSLYIRNYKNYSCCHTYVSDNTCNFNECETEYGSDQFIKITDLYTKNKINNTILVEDNKLVIGAYVRVYRFGREQFIQEIKDEIYENNTNVDDIKNEKYFEWKIDNWNSIKNRDVILSPEFRTNDYSWKLKLYPNGCKNRYQDNISIFLHNLSVMKNDVSELFNVYADIVFFIRNVNDYSFHYMIKKYDLELFNKYNNYCCLREFIEKSKVNSNEGGHQGLLEDNKIIFGVYICQYKPEKFDNFVKRMRTLLDDSQYRGNNILDERFFEDVVFNWEKDSKTYSFSNELYIGDYLWELTLLPDKDDKVTALALTCNEFDDEKSEKRNTNIYVKFVLYIRNYKNFNYIKSTSSGKYYRYNKDNKLLGVNEFIEDKELYDRSRHLLEDDKLVYGCYLRMYKKEPEIKIVNKDITVEFQSKDKKNGGGILYHYDENGDCDVKVYGYKLDKNDNIEYVNYDVEKFNTENPKLKKNNANQGKIELQNVLSESDLEDSDLEEEKPELAVAIGDYKADESYEVDFKLGDKIIILDWDYDDEYAKGIKCDDLDKKKLDKGFSLFPKEFIRKLDKKFVEDVENDRIKPPTKKPSKPPKATETSKPAVASPQPTMTSPLQPGVRPVYQSAYQVRPAAVPVGQPPVQVLPPNLQYSAAPRSYGQPVPQYTLSPPPQYAHPIPQSPYARPAAPGTYPPQPYGQAPPSPRPHYSYSVPPTQPVQQPAPQAYHQYSLPPQQPYSQPPAQSTLYPSLSPRLVPQSTLYPPLSPQPAPQPAPAPGTYPPQPAPQTAPAPGTYPPQPPYGQAPPPSPQPPYTQIPPSPQPPYNNIPSPQPSPYQQPYPMPQSYPMPSPQPKPLVPMEPQMQASAPPSSDNI